MEAVQETIRPTPAAIELATFRKAPAFRYEHPSTRRFFMNKARSLIRLAKRVHEGKLFLPDLVASLREAARALLDLGGFLLLTDRGQVLMDDLAWIVSPRFAPEGLDATVQEKARHRADPPERCTLCRARLVYPAEVVWRRGLEVVAVSAPIGIGCLNGRFGKLQDLITQVRIQREELHA